MPSELYVAVQFLAGRCDGAKTWDGMGFNKFDTRFGCSIASIPEQQWSQNMRNCAYRMVRKYRKQLLTFDINYDRLTPLPD